MLATRTEALHDQAEGLDARPLFEIAALLSEAQIEAATSTRTVSESIAKAAKAMATTIRQGGILHYAAAGSSGLMAAADAQELGGTYSIPTSQLCIHMAGGLPTGVEMPGDTEDDTAALEGALKGLSKQDLLIAVSASGTTQYTLEAARIARSKGATIVAIANNPGTALLDAADHPICLATPAEVISGSTRMGAGTAQKIALNMLSTLMAVELGHVHDGMMVNLHADNIKLRARAAGMVARIAGVDDTAAHAALYTTRGQVKPAVLVAAGLATDAAYDILRETEGNLRAALARLT